MPASRRPTPTRRSAARGRAAAPARAAAVRHTAPPLGARGLTGRAALLGLALCALLVAAALPLREYLAQRQELAAAEAANAAARARVAELEATKARLNDPAYVKAQAREKLHFVLPGETSYQLIPVTPSAAPRPSASAGTPVTPRVATSEQPWYSQLWATAQAADER
jgi:cell division protein FtsB